MNVLVDTCVWSSALRRRRGEPPREAIELAGLVKDGRALLLGIVRQELLSGVRTPGQFEKLRLTLRAFPDIAVETEDHETAAAFFNRCRARGIQGSAIDYLLCAVARRREISLFTTDADFERYATVLGIALHVPTTR